MTDRSQLEIGAEVFDHLAQAALSVVSVVFMCWMMYTEMQRSPVQAAAWERGIRFFDSPPPAELPRLDHENRAALHRDLRRLERGEASTPGER